jgi:hypothetical protein
MDPSQKAAAILALVEKRNVADWFDALPADAKDVLVAIRDQWRAERRVTQVSAASLARTILAQMPEHRFPATKGLAEWLLHSGEQ